MKPAWQVASLAGLVLLAVARSMLGTQLDGLTLDEPYHLLAAAAYAERGSYQLNPEHPPLVKRVAGVAVGPALQIPPSPPLRDEPLRNKLAERNLAERVIYLENDAARIQARARAAMFLFHGALLFALLLTARRVFGWGWAAVAGAWLALDPTVGAHLPLVMTDLSLGFLLALTALLAALAIQTLWGSSTSGRTLLAAGALGVAAGLALATKHSALPGLAGLALLCLAAAAWHCLADGEPRSRRAALVAGHGAIAVLMAWTTLWATYGFRYHAAPDGSDPFPRPLEAQIDALSLPAHQAALRLADRWRLAPRAYLWGLADTLRAGVEGRGQSRHRLFGHVFEGDPPAVFWPGLLASKIPLPHLLLVLCGLGCLLWDALASRSPHRRRPKEAEDDDAADLRRPAALGLAALGVVAAAHFLALLGARATYGGVRHALPLVVVLAFVAGGVVRLRRSRWPRGAVLLPTLLLTTTLALTAGEARLWEFHNALAGGTAGAAERFDNEGVHLGQRLPEVARVWHEELDDPPGPLYALLPLVEEEALSLGLPLTRLADLSDGGARGRYEGFFLAPSGWRELDRPWSHELAAAEGETLRRVARLGNVELLAGVVTSPQLRATGLLRAVGEALNRTPRPPWPTLARRMEEVVTMRPESTTAWILLGNAWVATGRRDDAVDAFRRAHETLADGDPARRRLQEHLEILASDTTLGEVPFLPPVAAE